MSVFKDEDQFDSFTEFWNQPGLKEHVEQIRQCLGCTTWQAFIAMRPRGVWWDEGEMDAEPESGEDMGEIWRHN